MEERAFRMWIYNLGLPEVYITNLYEDTNLELLINVYKIKKRKKLIFIK